MFTMQLTPRELGKLANFVVLLKWAREKSALKKPIYPKTQVAVDFDSFCAKQALANKLDVFFPLVIWEKWPGYDMVYRGHTLQAKLVYHFSNGLYYRHYGKFKADIGVVLTPFSIPYVFEVVGWLKQKEFRDNAIWEEMIETNLWVSPDLLHPFEELENIEPQSPRLRAD